MCQVLSTCAANSFTAQASKKRPLGSPVHYNLRIKRVRTPMATSALSHVSPRPTAAKIKTRPTRLTAAVPQAPVTVSRDLNAEVKALQRKMALMQAQVHDAADGIRQLRQLVGVLAMQRHRAAMLAVQC